LNETEREELIALTPRRTTAQALALRARIVLGCADGLGSKVVAARQRATQLTVGKWRRRYIEQRLDGLLDAARSGAPCSLDDARVDALVAKTLHLRRRHADELPGLAERTTLHVGANPLT
jgi:transposase